MILTHADTHTFIYIYIYVVRFIMSHFLNRRRFNMTLDLQGGAQS